MNKKIIKLNGGLGNQMFQYAFKCNLEESTNDEILFDLSYFEENPKDKNVVIRPIELGLFNTNYKKASQEDLNKIKNDKPDKNAITQRNAYSFERKMLNPKFYYYNGYFQNEKYFKKFRKKLLAHFSLKDNLDEKNQEMLNKIKESNSVSLHVRRGDYVTLNSASNFHGTCSLKYYEKAMKHMAKKLEDSHFFIFSDDPNWVVENLKIEHPYTLVDFNGDKGYLDLELMKNCKHNIIANSSFSWWAAWLNENPKKIVIAPKKWIAARQSCDIVPRKWIKI